MPFSKCEQFSKFASKTVGHNLKVYNLYYFENNSVIQTKYYDILLKVPVTSIYVSIT